MCCTCETTCSRNRFPFAVENTTRVTCFVSSTFNTCMCFEPLLSQVFFLRVGTRWILVWSMLTTRHGKLSKVSLGKLFCKPCCILVHANLLAFCWLLLLPCKNTSSCNVLKIVWTIPL